MMIDIFCALIAIQKLMQGLQELPSTKNSTKTAKPVKKTLKSCIPQSTPPHSLPPINSTALANACLPNNQEMHVDLEAPASRSNEMEMMDAPLTQIGRKQRARDLHSMVHCLCGDSVTLAEISDGAGVVQETWL